VSGELRAFVPAAPWSPPRGQFTMNGVNVITVAEPSVTANSYILYSPINISGTLGIAAIVKNPGVGFSVTGVALAASTYCYMILEP
jgi:hypothetical protein